MKKKIVLKVSMARIITDQRDGRKDKFIPLDDAKMKTVKGELVQLEMGPAYPWSYEATGDGTR